MHPFIEYLMQALPFMAIAWVVWAGIGVLYFWRHSLRNFENLPPAVDLIKESGLTGFLGGEPYNFYMAMSLGFTMLCFFFVMPFFVPVFIGLAVVANFVLGFFPMHIGNLAISYYLTAYVNKNRLQTVRGELTTDPD